VKEHSTAILGDSRLPMSFWEETFECFAYVWNRFPTSKVETSPFEEFFERLPRPVALFPVGSLVVAALPVGQRRNLRNRGQAFVMVGYAPTHDACYSL
jgi:hypothetical protein